MGSVSLPALVGALVLGLALGAGPIAAAPPTLLRVVTFNLLHGGPLSGVTGYDAHLDERLRLVAAELRQVDPDIVGLQEAAITRGRHVAARLARELGLHWAHASATRRVSRIAVFDRLVVGAMGFEEGPAILSRWPIVESTVIDLPRCLRFHEPRVALHAVVAAPAGRLHVYSTHLTRDDCQKDRLTALLRASPGLLPAILTGDFNATETSPSIQALVRDAGLVDVYRAANATAPGLTVWQRPYAPEPTVSRRVDYIFLRPGSLPVTVRSSRIILSTPGRLADGRPLWPSDHYGVVGEVAVGRAETGR